MNQCGRDVERTAGTGSAGADESSALRTENRPKHRSGHYERQLLIRSGEVTLRMPKLKGAPLETAIIERYRRRGNSVEETLIEMYLSGV